MELLERFLKYVAYPTASDEKSETTPSTPEQIEFAKYLVEDLKSIGMQEVELDGNGYVMATLPATTDKNVPTIGFIAHIDTSPDASGKSIKPMLVRRYEGGNILLNEEKGIVLKTKVFPEIQQYMGLDIVVTDGTTLLGADDKAGIAEIVTAMQYLITHPEIKHGKIRICFTPDEEIGRGADKFDVAKFGCKWAYTIDGGEIGEIEYENFNAASAVIKFNGRNVHPGYAYHKMINAMRLAAQFINMLPRYETPEHTEDYEGFFHLTGMEGNVDAATLHYIVRDHDKGKFEKRKKELQHLVNKTNGEFGEGTAEIEIKDQYYNMKEQIEPVMHVIDLVKTSMKEIGIKPKIKPIRGGTDGARLSFMGLPCPNIFAGGHNFHGRFEYVPVQSMEKARDLIVRIIENAAK
jgi:tripeptide aminopeptidase